MNTTEFLDAIQSQRCPFCGVGPWRLLSIHTGRAHSVDASELKRLAGLAESASTASQVLSDIKREHALAADFGSASPPAGSESRRRAAPKIAAASRSRGNAPEAKAAFRERMATQEVSLARERTRLAKIQGHGTVASYKRGCRCDQCREAKNGPRRSGRSSGRPPRFTDEHFQMAMSLMAGGMTQRAAAAEVGVSEAWLSLRRRSK